MAGVMRIPKIRDDEITAAIDWARADAEDDFCPDYIHYSDYGLVSRQHVSMLITPCLRPDMHQLARLVVPRATSLLCRETPWFPFPLRITYMLLLRRLLPALRPCLSPSCYSSRPGDLGGQEYPWRGAVSAWAQFNNEYRKLILERGSDGFAVATDVTAFYEHIAIGDFVAGLRAVLDDGMAGVDEELTALETLLQAAAFKGRGLPQNMDPSRLFADVYMRVVDDRLRAVSGLSYLRYVDDIRIVAHTRGAAMRGLQELEIQLKAAGLFLNSKKTELIDPGAAEWAGAKEADHDFKLAQCDRLLAGATQAEIEECLRVTGNEMQAASKRGDDRLVRAYGNRLLRVAQFVGVRLDACRQLEAIALEGFRTHPGGADRWASFVSPALSQEGVQELVRLLSAHDYNSYAWTNMWMVIAMGRAKSLPGEAMDALRAIVLNRSEPDYLRGWAAVAFARHGGGLRRREVVDVCLTESNRLFLRRAAVLAAQQLPSSSKSDVRAQTIRMDPTLALLWDYLDSRATYDWYAFPSRDFAEPGTKPEQLPSFKATGLVEGRPTTFNAFSRGTDYEVE